MKTGHVMFKVIAILLLASLVSGCAVGMALSGKKEVDVAKLHVGQPRPEVIAMLGNPIKTTTTETGSEDVFKCQAGNAPSLARAMGHGVMDVLTGGLWEVAGTPFEVFQGSTYYLTITYDEDGRVVNVKASDKKGVD